MVIYVALTLAKFGLQWKRSTVVQKRVAMAYVFFLGLMSWNLYLHLAKRTPGAYSSYAIYEWIFLTIDIFSDVVTIPPIRFDVARHAKTVFIYGAEIISSMMFFTHITELPLTLWHFPLWNMGLSGHEIVLLVYVAAPLLYPYLPHDYPYYLFSISTASIITLLPLTTNPTIRLHMVMLSTAASICRMMTKISSDIHYVKIALNGLLTTCVLKFVAYGNNPLWMIYPKQFADYTLLSWNHLSLLVAICIPLMDYLTTYHLTKSKEINHNATKNGIPLHETKWTCALALGSLFYILHTYATDLTILLLHNHSASGKEIQGTGEYGTLSVVLIFFSMLIGINWRIRLSNQLLVAIAIVPTFISTVDSCKAMWAYVMLTRQMLPWMQASMRMMAIITFTYLILLLADTFTTAYAFVPGGNLLREKSLYIWGLSHLLLFLFPKNKLFSFEPRNKHRTIYRWLSWMYSGFITVIFITAALMQTHVKNNQGKLVRFGDQRLLTVGIWTVHFGLDNEGMLSHQKMERVIRKLDLDVIGLLESDTMRNYGGNRNMLTYLGQKLNMHGIYGPRPNEHTWGCAMLSKYPIISHTTHLLPSPNGELACAIHAKIMTKTGVVDILVSHNGQEEDLLDRQLQTREIGRIIEEVEGPMIFLGYLVTKPGMEHEIYRIMAERMTDIYSKDLKRWCQYIFYKELKAIGYARITHGNITDTEIQTAKFWIGGNLHNSTEEIVLQGRSLYSKDFKGEGWNGHRYQRWRRALYTPEV